MAYEGDLTYFLLVLARMSGCVFFNQIFGRGTLPATFKIALSLMLTITVYGIIPPTDDILISSILEYGLVILKEVFIGFLIGYIISMFFSVIVIGGEIIDMQIGMSMSKIYDPSSNISMGVSGSFLNAFIILLFFSARGHLSLIQIFITSCKLIEIGSFTIPQNLFYNMVEMFSQILIFSIKLALPVLAVEIITEAGVGILMKAIPQIQVFSVNIQLKLFVGLFIVMILVPSFSVFLENILTIMFETIQRNLSLLIS
ncbi:flagellar biosynthetic protein FliR [Sedimentibacter acidaminivorans]|uniref:Flagellar biosynthetic protein FliR n=1 Tax=Sedimentibacter acidaminivorans TaxID=913099 RepID=A0ABS4GDG0_9FIRM|nr:flagellar biosynthetic protein FliR [Sedimentibacter acidaminivorans]MBP1925736.1 flagellar biosynthetic protein FliR [Sedimentibacter acidaminivorans]